MKFAVIFMSAHSPASQPPPLPNPAGSHLAKIGLWLQLAPLIGITDTMRQLWALFREALERAQAGEAAVDVTLISKMMQVATTSSLTGTIISCIGALLVLLAYTKYHYRPKWAFWFLIAFVALGFMSLPVVW